MLICDGKGLSISHVGSSKFLSLLIVPSAYFYNKFFKVYFEIHHDACFVKDRASNMVVLQGKLKDGLYSFDQTQIQLSSSPQACPASTQVVSSPAISNFSVLSFTNDNKSSSMYNLWHNRLCHPAQKTVRAVLSSCNIALDNKSTELCSSCCLGKMHKFISLINHTIHYSFPVSSL